MIWQGMTQKCRHGNNVQGFWSHKLIFFKRFLDPDISKMLKFLDPEARRTKISDSKEITENSNLGSMSCSLKQSQTHLTPLYYCSALFLFVFLVMKIYFSKRNYRITKFFFI